MRQRKEGGDRKERGAGKEKRELGGEERSTRRREGKGRVKRETRKVASQERIAYDQLTGKMYEVITCNYILDKTEKCSKRKGKDLCFQQIFIEH